ncbi:MAG: putative metalloendopeptidase [Parcubacteria group bacterium Gr01-1014_49]|nr:MAG: putative metalloendopeptidase [Parcubacteria group bacterium Gr01-1014_49]
MDRSVGPGDDFFHYAVGGWLKRNPIPPTEARWGSFYLLRENARQDLREILKGVAGTSLKNCDKDERLVRALWLSVLDERERARRAVKPLADIFKKIDAIADAKSLVRFFGQTEKIGMGGVFAPYVGRDDKDSGKNVLHLVQSGLSLPDRDYYLKDDEDSKKVRAAYRAYIPRLLKLAGYSAARAKHAVETIMHIETELAKASMTRVECRDPHALYNKRNLHSLSREAAGIDWKHYFEDIGAGAPREVVVGQPKFLKRTSELLREVPVEDWKTYLRWHAINGFAGILSPALERESFRFYATELSGVKKMRSKEERAVSVVDGALGDALGKLYVRKHFSPKAKRRINELVDNLFLVYRDRIGNLDWMSAATKKKALRKLSKMKRKLGYPSKWRTYRGVSLDARDYFGNAERIHQYEWRRMMAKLGKKPDPTEWHMTAPTVNAYFDPNANEIVFPAGIMQPPFFDANADDALNYGGIGSVIGHEITHGFDDAGRQFDEKGNLKEWWTKEDAKRFKKRAEVLKKQYNGFIAIDDMHVNGELTLGENIADLGGVVIAYDAFKRSQKGKKQENIDGLTPDERFFLGFAMAECGHTRPEALKKQVVTDPHSPSIFRVNGPLPHLDAFYEIFGVRRGQKLFRPAKDRVKIW